MSFKINSNNFFSLSIPVATGLFVSLLCLLSGCIPITKRSVTPIDLPANFSLQGEVPQQAEWWLDFRDDSLTFLVNRAITDNFSLRTAREKITEAQAVARQAGAALVPAVDSQSVASSTRNSTTETTRKDFFLGLAASYEIDLWSKLRNQQEAAILDAQATEADYHAATISLAAEVAATWYQLVETDLQRALLNQQKETNSKVLELISTQFRTGKVGIADVLQQRQLVESNIGALAGLRRDARILEHQLTILVGLPPGTLTLPQRVQLPTLPPLPKTGIPLDVLTTRPDIESSYRKLRAADYRVAKAVADRLPQLSISAELSTSGVRSGDLFNNWLSTLGANLFGPLIDGGRRRAVVTQAESVAQQRFYTHGQTILAAISEVEDNLVREKEQQIVLTSLKTQLQYATETIDHVANRYRQGVVDYQRVLLALLSQQGLQRDILAGNRQLIHFRISLYRALSGRISLQQTMPVTEQDTDNDIFNSDSFPARGSN